MHYISKAEEWAIKLYPDNKDGCTYKLSDYTIVNKYGVGYIVFNTITWSLYYLTKDEYDGILENDTMIKNKVVIDNTIEEVGIAEHAYLKRSMRPNKNKYEHVDSYIVFTTNTCNAHCPYCYESDKIGSMSEETAEKLIEFIKEKRTPDGSIVISWFGGEPLKNITIMDYISKRLKEEGIQFESKMTSNCSLFTPDLTNKAIYLWNLTDVQVTIDGPEELYNSIKNYDGIKGSAFKVVTDNIRYLVNETGIHVVIRINVSPDNIDYVQELVNYLNEHVSNGNSLNYDIKMIYQAINDVEILKTNDFEERYNSLVEELFPNRERNLVKKENLMMCMADYCTGIAIGVNGNIYNCEHISPCNCIGNLDDRITGTTTIENTVNKGGKNLDICKEYGCKLMPICKLANFCEVHPRCQNHGMVEHENEILNKRLKETAKYYFERLEEIKKGRQ